MSAKIRISVKRVKHNDLDFASWCIVSSVELRHLALVWNLYNCCSNICYNIICAGNFLPGNANLHFLLFYSWTSTTDGSVPTYHTQICWEREPNKRQCRQASNSSSNEEIPFVSARLVTVNHRELQIQVQRTCTW